MSVLHASSQTPATQGGYHARTCPECGTTFAPRAPGTLFCSGEHRAAWNNRATVRGRVLTPLTMVSRITREGTRGDRDTGARAAHDARTLIRRWVDEDRAAGRMPWPEYLRRRYAGGFDPL